MSDTLGRRLISASAVLTLLVALIFGAMLLAIRDVRDAGRQERHSEQVIAASSAMQTLVLNLETSARGYVIAREEPFLRPWKRNVAGFPASAARFDSLVRQPQQRQLERAIVANVRSYIDDYSKDLVATARHDPRAAAVIVSSGEGRRRVDALRAQLGTLVGIETTVAAHEHVQADSAGSRAKRAGIAGIVGSALLILGFALYLARTILTPLRRMASERTTYEVSVREPETGRNASLKRQN
ncbi:MAG: CHASE3 domain-containing protein, partial [Actinomycetota bacterium]|nr:CHASE3 domain-containing protein [Actinomycetota bacterium]